MSRISPPNYEFFDQMSSTWLPGDYLVIDPCYVFGEDPFWRDMCDYHYSDHSHHPRCTFVLIDGRICTFFNTDNGDGSDPVYDGDRQIGTAVDGGMLSLIPINLLEDLGISDDMGLGVTVQIHQEFFPVIQDGNGTFGNITVVTNDGTFGNITVVTNGEDEDDDEIREMDEIEQEDARIAGVQVAPQEEDDDEGWD